MYQNETIEFADLTRLIGAYSKSRRTPDGELELVSLGFVRNGCTEAVYDFEKHVYGEALAGGLIFIAVLACLVTISVLCCDWRNKNKKMADGRTA